MDTPKYFYVQTAPATKDGAGAIAKGWYIVSDGMLILTDSASRPLSKARQYAAPIISGTPDAIISQDNREKTTQQGGPLLSPWRGDLLVALEEDRRER